MVVRLYKVSGKLRKVICLLNTGFEVSGFLDTVPVGRATAGSIAYFSDSCPFGQLSCATGRNMQIHRHTHRRAHAYVCACNTFDTFE